MKKILIYLIMAMPLFSKPITKTYNYSDKYKIISTTNEKSEDILDWTVVILDKKTKKVVLKDNKTINGKLLGIDSGDNYYSIIEGNLEGIILNQDFNFDGKKDFAIFKSSKKCESGVSYDIYLATNDGFKYSKEYSVLCGYFEMNNKKKEIKTEDIAGDIIGVFTTYKVENNNLIKIISVERTITESGVKEKIRYKK